MGTPYVALLSSELERNDWALCQLHMRSSYLGFGIGSLNQDFEDISECLSYLQSIGKVHVVLMGHSTGSQNSIHYVLNRLDNENLSPAVCGVIVRQVIFR
jgi:predicted alpha/beta-fold hydrolase